MELSRHLFINPILCYWKTRAPQSSVFRASLFNHWIRTKKPKYQGTTSPLAKLHMIWLFWLTNPISHHFPPCALCSSCSSLLTHLQQAASKLRALAVPEPLSDLFFPRWEHGSLLCIIKSLFTCPSSTKLFLTTAVTTPSCHWNTRYPAFKTTWALWGLKPSYLPLYL